MKAIAVEKPYVKLWIGNLGLYNEGALVGEWFDLPCDWEEVAAALQLNEEYEEVHICDYETNISGLKIERYDNIDKLNEFAERLEDLKEYEIHVLSAYMEEFGSSNLLDIFDDWRFDEAQVYYETHSMSDIVSELLEDGYFGEIPDIIRRNIDLEDLGDDWGQGESYVFLDDGICVYFPS